MTVAARPVWKSCATATRGRNATVVSECRVQRKGCLRVTDCLCVIRAGITSYRDIGKTHFCPPPYLIYYHPSKQKYFVISGNRYSVFYRNKCLHSFERERARERFTVWMALALTFGALCTCEVKAGGNSVHTVLSALPGHTSSDGRWVWDWSELEMVLYSSVSSDIPSSCSPDNTIQHTMTLGKWHTSALLMATEERCQNKPGFNKDTWWSSVNIRLPTALHTPV